MKRAIIEGAKEIRELADLTGEQLAFKAGVSVRSIWVVDAETPVKLSTAKKVAKGLGIPFDQIKIIND